MSITNAVVIVGSGWETRISVISAQTGHELVNHLCELVANGISVPQIIRDADMNAHSFIIPSEIKSVRLESGISPRVTADQIMLEHLAVLKAQKAWYKSNTREDGGF